MASVLIVLLGIAGMLLGWFVYSKFIAERIFQLDPNFKTPAHELRDGVDFVPTNKVVLWGHHFTSVAGAAPIVGPAIAVFWGVEPTENPIEKFRIKNSGPHQHSDEKGERRKPVEPFQDLTPTVLEPMLPQSVVSQGFICP